MVVKSGILINIYMVILAWDMCLILFIVSSNVIGVLQSVNGNMVENEKSFFLVHSLKISALRFLCKKCCNFFSRIFGGNIKSAYLCIRF